MDAWANFFVRAGIPKDIAHKYAKYFENNRITKDMLTDLDKSTLAELGVTAIGDQLCILRRCKAAKSAIERGNNSDFEDMESPRKATSQKARITAPTVNMTGISGNSELRRGKPPPDRHEIYHVKMPVGNTHRTRQIMQKAEEMREQGLAVRGTTGVRQGGRSVSPIDKSSLAARLQRKQTSEVSSSTDRRQGTTKIARISGGITKTISNRPSLSSRLTTSSTAPSGSSLRIKMDSNGRKPSRIEGRLQKAGQVSSGIYIQEDVVYDDMEDDVEYEDEMPYEEEIEEEVYEDVVSVPVRDRISFGGAAVSSSNRMRSTVHRVPPRVTLPSSSSSHHHSQRHRRHDSPPPRRIQEQPPTVFERLSFNNRR